MAQFHIEVYDAPSMERVFGQYFEVGVGYDVPWDTQTDSLKRETAHGRESAFWTASLKPLYLIPKVAQFKGLK